MFASISKADNQFTLSKEIYMEILSYILSFAGLACIIAASLVKGKNMKTILFLVFMANSLVATGYLVGGIGINGAISCYIGSAQTIINYFFECKGKPLPKWLVALYCVAFVVVNIVVGGSNIMLCALAIIASLTFVMCIGQKSGAKYRFWTIVNMILWCSYDLFSKSFSALIGTHIPQLAFTVVGMIIHDRKKK